MNKSNININMSTNKGDSDNLTFTTILLRPCTTIPNSILAQQQRLVLLRGHVTRLCTPDEQSFTANHQIEAAICVKP